MSELKLKIRNKIYTSGNHIIDTKNNNNAIIVFLGDSSTNNIKPYVENFLKDTLKSQISGSKITFVELNQNNVDKLGEKVSQAVRKIDFNPAVKNELFISFVSMLDDDIYNSSKKIDVSEIEELKISALGGFAVEIFYDFYGIFSSVAKYENRLNARKTIVDFLDGENGGVNIRKRIYHQACPGDDYYRSAKSITFMILANLIGKIDNYIISDSKVDGNSYTWTTFSLFEKNLASLVIYEMINKLLNNQINGTEIISTENIMQAIKDKMSDVESQLKRIAAPGDINYIPVVVKKTERKLSFVEKSKNIFSKDKISSVVYRKENEEVAVDDLLDQQKKSFENHIKQVIDESYIDSFIVTLIKMCTVMSSINNSQNEALILKSLENCKKELLDQMHNSSAAFMGGDSTDYYIPKYNKLMLSMKVQVLDKIIEYFKNNINEYVEKIQEHWNIMNIEVSNMINDFAAFHDYFDGIGDLISDKSIPLMSDYDDILEKIDVRSVVRAIDRNTNIYSSILQSYYDNIQAAGDIAKRFGNRNIVPDIDKTAYTLFSNINVVCPNNLRLVSDEYWFREHEIAILFTAKNNMSDCDNLPFSV